jgi:hypothetical protein
LLRSPHPFGIDPDPRDENLNHLAFELDIVVALNVFQAVTEPC